MDCSICAEWLSHAVFIIPSILLVQQPVVSLFASH